MELTAAALAPAAAMVVILVCRLKVFAPSFSVDISFVRRKLCGCSSLGGIVLLFIALDVVVGLDWFLALFLYRSLCCNRFS